MFYMIRNVISRFCLIWSYYCNKVWKGVKTQMMFFWCYGSNHLLPFCPSPIILPLLWALLLPHHGLTIATCTVSLTGHWLLIPNGTRNSRGDLKQYGLKRCVCYHGSFQTTRYHLACTVWHCYNPASIIGMGLLHQNRTIIVQDGAYALIRWEKASPKPFLLLSSYAFARHSQQFHNKYTRF